MNLLLCLVCGVRGEVTMLITLIALSENKQNDLKLQNIQRNQKLTNNLKVPVWLKPVYHNNMIQFAQFFVFNMWQSYIKAKCANPSQAISNRYQSENRRKELCRKALSLSAYFRAFLLQTSSVTLQTTCFEWYPSLDTLCSTRLSRYGCEIHSLVTNPWNKYPSY